ncbi:MAG TPA: TIGR03619 family F420-dependent LLM class oxidoreductase [Jatrophihabitans sp.]|jgi:probable F420-dependent oxidoreductase
MKLSLALPFDQRTLHLELIEPEALIGFAAAIEKGGFDACYVTDHPFPTADWFRSGGHHTLEPLVALSFIAAATTTLKLHTNCYIPAYRHPFVSAKSIATLDRLSRGRLILGVAVGYLEEEFDGLGASFADRGHLLDEAIRQMRLAWTGEEINGEGEGYRTSGNVVLPTPHTTAGPPIWIGGNSRAAIRRAVEYADGWMPFPAPRAFADAVRTQNLTDRDGLAAEIRHVRELCERAGREAPLDVCFTPFSHPAGRDKFNPEAFIEEALALREIGVTWLSFHVPAPSVEQFHDHVAEFAETVVPVLKAG